MDEQMTKLVKYEEALIEIIEQKGLVLFLEKMNGQQRKIISPI